MEHTQEAVHPWVAEAARRVRFGIDLGPVENLMPLNDLEEQPVGPTTADSEFRRFPQRRCAYGTHRIRSWCSYEPSRSNWSLTRFDLTDGRFAQAARGAARSSASYASGLW